MNVTIPIYVEHHLNRYTIKPLFLDGPTEQHEKLERAIHLLSSRLREILRDLGNYARHDELAQYTFSPNWTYDRIEVRIELRKRIARCKFLFVLFREFDRRIAFSPTLPEVWFEVQRGEDLSVRATEVLTRHFRELEKDDIEQYTKPENWMLKGTAWISSVDLDIYPQQIIQDPDKQKFAFLGSLEQMHGEQELFRVGRCLDQLYPDDLDRALMRDQEVDELMRLLSAKDKRPILILGPPLIGKTTLIHECVWRRVDRRNERHRIRECVWLLSPQRLISGMSYVGQWQERLLAILKETQKKKHVLYFDDFLGLYSAGKSASSDLTVAHVLKPYVEQRKLRIVTEMTPDAFRVLREQDRGFADLFHVIHVSSPTEEENLRILISVARQLEAQHECELHIDTLPAVLDVQRRYARQVSFPGKAAVFLRRLAVKHRRGFVDQESVLQEFHAQSGLSMFVLNGRDKLQREDVVKQLSRRLIGQKRALEAAADVICIAKARLNDPDRPLASFLFLGPTGVGKTQCAKVIAHYLFGDEERLIRLDMNEYLEMGSAARLVGTFSNPEGLLTSAVQRQPFSVILLDEIEKAHPEVFDVLLQVLGEGRLTDALGRTADFGNTIIILTSNLGVRQASMSFGFRNEEDHDLSIYEKAAEQFFRPEFFNRLDRIVPFERLSRDEIAQIARILMEGFLQREGLLRRKCILRVEEEALESVIDSGFDPILGARALKRSLEKQLTQPIANQLAAGMPETMTVVRVLPGPETLQVHLQTLEQTESVKNNSLSVDLSQPMEVVRLIRKSVHEMESKLAPLKPQGEITVDALEGEHYSYYVVQEQLREVRERVKVLEERLDKSYESDRVGPALPVESRGRTEKILSIAMGDIWGGARNLKGSMVAEMASVQDLNQYLKDLADQARAQPNETAELLTQALQEVARATLLTRCALENPPTRTLMYVQLPQEHRGAVLMLHGFARSLYACYRGSFNLEKVPVLSDELTMMELGIVWRGVGSYSLASLERGTHLFVRKNGSLCPVQVMVWPLTEEVDADVFLRQRREELQEWPRRWKTEEMKIEDDPLPWGKILRIYHEQGSTIDCRTGMVSPSKPVLLPMVLSTLELPEEFSQVAK